MGRGRSGGGGGGRVSGAGSFGGSGPAASERQQEYVHTLLTQSNVLDTLAAQAVSEPGPHEGNQEAHEFAKQAATFEGEFGAVTRFAPGTLPGSRIELGKRLSAASVKWGAGLDPSTLSRSGASALIDAAKGGKVGAFIQAHGGTTARARASFLSRATGMRVTSAARTLSSGKVVEEIVIH